MATVASATAILFALAPPAQAQPRDPTDEGATHSGFTDTSRFGRGPDDITNQLRRADEVRQARAPLEGLDQLFQPWYDAKSKLREQLGLQFGVAYTPLYQVASERLPGSGSGDAAGGIFELLGTWTLLGRRSDTPGVLGFRVEDRHRLGTGTAPQFLFADVGSGWPTAPGFAEFDLSLAELWWEQTIVPDRVGIRFGKVLPFAYFDYFALKSPKTAFTDAALALNPTIAWPQFGLGAMATVRPRDDIYFTAGIHDANGRPTSAGFDTFFDDREYFVIAEVGWDPGFLGENANNPLATDIHLTAWHVDAREKAGRPEGWGLTLGGQHQVGDLVPFAKYGYSDGGAAILRQLVSAGVGFTNAFGYRQDVVGVGASWGQPSDRQLRDQYSAELYYKMQWTQRLALTPAVQLIANPSSNPGEDLIALFGIRGRLDF